MAQRVIAASRRILLAAALQDAAAGVQKIWRQAKSDTALRRKKMEPVLKKRQKLHAFALRHGVDALLRQFVSRGLLKFVRVVRETKPAMLAVIGLVIAILI